MTGNFSIKSLLGDMVYWAVWLIVLALSVVIAPAILLGFSFLFREDLLSVFVYAIGKGPNALFLIFGIVYGLLTGLLQWILLRRRIDRASRWIWATFYGAMVGWFLISVIPIPGSLTDGVNAVLYSAAVSSAISAIAQWFVIRKQVKFSYLWIILSILGWSCVAFATPFSNVAGLRNFEAPGAIFGLMIVATTAAFLFGRGEQKNFNALVLAGISLLFVVGFGVTTRITYLQHNQQVMTFQAKQDQTGYIGSVAFSSDGTRIAGAFSSWSAAQFKPIRVWDIQSGKELFSIPTEYAADQIGFSPDGSMLSMVDLAHKVTLWNADSGALIRRVPIVVGVPKAFAFSPDGGILAIGNNSSDGTVTLWDIQDDRALQRLFGSGEVNSIAYNPAGELVVVRADKIEVWDLASRKITRVIPIVDTYVNASDHYAFSIDGRYLVATGASTNRQGWKASIWDLTNGVLLQKLDLEGNNPVAISPDGKILAIVSKEIEGVRLLDTGTWQEVKTLKVSSILSNLAFSSDGSMLAAGTYGGSIHLFELR